jgi:hypothetical protein
MIGARAQEKSILEPGVLSCLKKNKNIQLRMLEKASDAVTMILKILYQELVNNAFVSTSRSSI